MFDMTLESAIFGSKCKFSTELSTAFVENVNDFVIFNFVKAFFLNFKTPICTHSQAQYTYV